MSLGDRPLITPLCKKGIFFMKRLSDEELSILAEKWLDGSITPEEKQRFDTWYEKQPDPEIVVQTSEGDQNLFRERIMARIKATAIEKKPAPRLKWWISRVAAAAVIVLAVGLAYLWWQPTPVIQNRDPQLYDLAPGGNKAILTLGNGRQILLDSVHTGQLASLGHYHIIKLGSGQLAFQPSDAPAGQNKLTTPNGGSYQIELPDGSQVWLNAASSISFPSSFSGNTREVAITGEAYFEVKHDAEKPFIVRSGNTIIRDIGTRFNVMAYADESVKKVTLQEGAVEVTHAGDNQKQLLTPGQQVQVSPTGKFTWIKQIDADAAIAWKEGRFNFQDADLQTVMRQLSRWYNVEVIYANGIPDLEFIGQVQRDLPLSEVLKGLRMSGVHFKLEQGRRLIVLP